MVGNLRAEENIFTDLSNLCVEPGFVHVIAGLCFRDNTIKYADTIKSDDVIHMHSMERLIRTEISTLIGLLIKNDIDYTIPKPDVFQSMSDKAESLLDEIHKSMTSDFFSGLTPEKIGDKSFNPFAKASALREPIFYGGESAYIFQYRDLSEKKYAKDDEWFKRNKGYSSKLIRDVIKCIGDIQNEKVLSTIEGMRSKHPDEWSILPAYIVTIKELVARLDDDESEIRAVMDSFSVPQGSTNESFSSISDFNISNAYPLININIDEYLLLQLYSLAEAYYETPFYWFNEDSSYINTAMLHRGQFTEEFSEERLKLVFGQSNVYTNIDIVDGKGNKAGEIDVLVVYANRAIIVQAKSKKLTLASRKGNDNVLKDDFKKAIQDSYNQGYSCALLLQDHSYRLHDSSSNEINVNKKFKEIYIFCVISDHYPALTFQSRQFLKYKQTDTILPPFIMDVFHLDVMSEMLQSPLQFLSYANRRSLYTDSVMASLELTILAYHLKRNLWMSGEVDCMHFSDDIAADLDIAMMVRREGVDGDKTPDGILTRFNNYSLGQLIFQIEKLEDPGIIDLGFMLLYLDEDTVKNISAGIDKISALTSQDGKTHDLTIPMIEGGSGLTIHCNNYPISVAGPKLERHAEIRKYSVKSNDWFGICIEPKTKKLKFGLTLSEPWKQSDDMDKAIEGLPKPQKITNLKTKVKGRKIGRNEKCPCGSGKKFKKCCLQH